VETFEGSNMEFSEVTPHPQASSKPDFNPDQYYQELVQQFSYPRVPLNFRARLRKNPGLWREIRRLEEQLDRVWVRVKHGDALRENLYNLMTQLKETLTKGLQFVGGAS